MTFYKRKNLLFSLVICAILAVPCGYAVAQKLLPGFSASNFLHQQDVHLLEGGASTDFSIKEHLSLKSFADRTLQKGVEDKIENVIPGRYYLLLGDAALQRTCIDLSNSFFHFDSYPTRFASDSLYIPSSNSLQAFPIKATSENQNRIEWLSKKLVELAKDYPEKHFCVIIADNSETSRVLPAAHLTSNVLSTSMLADQLDEKLRSIPNISVVDDTYEDIDSYYRHYYSTDHHWNGWGAVAAYNRALQRMSADQQIDTSFLETSAAQQELAGLNELDFNGSYSRNGLMLLDEKLNEPLITTDNMIIEYDHDYPCPYIAFSDRTDRLKEQTGASFEFYGYWYGKYCPKMIIEQEGVGPTQENALIIGDSYSSAFRWVAATRFNQITSYQDMHTSARSVQGIKKKLEETDANYVFIVAGAPNYLRLAKTLPEYFD